MFSYIWSTFFFNPVYNALVFFVDAIPGGDIGVAIIITTVLLKVILLPLSIKAAKTQKIMREIEPKLRELKEKYKDDREKQAQEMLAIYKEAGMNPFSAFFVMLIQIPFVIALYFSVLGLPEVNADILYSFLSAPEAAAISMNFLNLFDISERSLILALLAGGTMFIQMNLMLPPLAKKDATETPDFKSEFTRNLQMQMKYVLPVIITIFAFVISAAIALYFVVTNIIAILQELYIRRHR